MPKSRRYRRNIPQTKRTFTPKPENTATTAVNQTVKPTTAGRFGSGGVTAAPPPLVNITNELKWIGVTALITVIVMIVLVYTIR
jgi:hypothetical protein